MLSTLVSSVLDVERTVDKTRKIAKHKMLHRTREICDSKVILLVFAVEEVEAFAVVVGAIFFDNRKSDVQGLYLETGVQDYSLLLLKFLDRSGPELPISSSFQQR